MKVLIVGGVAAGASAAARFRRLDEEVEIIMFEKGDYISFANCGLPYYIGGEITDKEELSIQTPESFNSRFAVDVRLHQEVTGLDTDAKTVTVKNHTNGETYSESYDKLLLATGSTPVIPPFDGMNDDYIYTLRTIPDAERIYNAVQSKKVKDAVVIGGGFIGIETAENLVHQGVKVTLVEMMDQILPPFDAEMAVGVSKHMEARGVDLFLSEAVKSFEEKDGRYVVQTDQREIPTDMVIMSVGVRPDTDFIKDSGVELNRRGAIVVDDNLRTSAKDVYAAGDAIEVTDFVTGAKTQIPLAGPANKQGRIVADNLAGLGTTYKGSQGSSILRAFDISAAQTGISEKTAIAQKIAYDKVYVSAPSNAGYYPGGDEMMIKCLFEKKTGRVLGVQIVGRKGVDKRCDVFATAIRAGMTVTDLTELDLCYAPPFAAAKEAANMVGYVAENVFNGQVKQVYTDEYKNLPKDGSVTILDVRRADERAEAGKLNGAMHIPIDELRDRMDEVAKDKPVYIHCRSGPRSYLACRMLTQNGYDCYSYAGGFELFKNMDL